MVDASQGVGGSYCGRCVGLGKGRECAEVGTCSLPTGLRFADDSLGSRRLPEGGSDGCQPRRQVEQEPVRQPHGSVQLLDRRRAKGV